MLLWIIFGLNLGFLLILLFKWINSVIKIYRTLNLIDVVIFYLCAEVYLTCFSLGNSKISYGMTWNVLTLVNTFLASTCFDPFHCCKMLYTFIPFSGSPICPLYILEMKGCAPLWCWILFSEPFL